MFRLIRNNFNKENFLFIKKTACMSFLLLMLVATTVKSETQDCESGTGWIDTHPNTNDFTISNWQFEIYNNHSISRTTNDFASETHSIKIFSTQGANGGPHVRYNGPKLNSFYQAFWIKVIRSGSKTFGGSGNALKLMGSRTNSNENELMARDSSDGNQWLVYMTNNVGGAKLYFPFINQSSSDPLLLSFGEWHYIKIFQDISGNFDMWIDNKHVQYVNTKWDGTGSWKALPMNDYDVTAKRTIIWWNLNYSGGGPASNITYYEDDFYYGAEDPRFPGRTGGGSFSGVGDTLKIVKVN